MPDDYDFSIPIKKGLKFKGDKSKIGKKKRKQKQKKLKLEQKELETEIEHKHVHEGSSHESENENTNTNINEGLMDKIPLEKDSPNDSDDDLGKTEAEKKFETIRRKRLEKILMTKAAKTHEQRIAEYNEYLASLSEHNEMPKIGPG